MIVRFHQVDEEDAVELHKLAFAGDPWWDAKGGTYWVGLDVTTKWALPRQRVVAFCGATLKDDPTRVFLSRAAVTKTAQGLGLQRRMIRMRCAWGKRQGAKLATTYTSIDNWSSIANLIRCGFEFYDPKDKYVGTWHYFRKTL